MPRVQNGAFGGLNSLAGSEHGKLRFIDQYYSRRHCVVCHKLTDQGSHATDSDIRLATANTIVCESCSKEPQKVIYTLTCRQRSAQRKLRNILNTCRECTGLSPLEAKTSYEQSISQCEDVPCVSLNCPIYYERLAAKKDVQALLSYNKLLDGMSFS